MERTVLILTLATLIGCQSTEQKTTGTNQPVASEAVNRGGSFKYGHIESFSPGIFKNDSLTLIDSLFHSEILNQIIGYNVPFSHRLRNHFISKQNDFNGLTALTVSLYWDLCYEGLILLILDKDRKLLNAIPLTEWYSSCDLSSNTETTFTTDSTFVQHILTTEHGGETELVTEIKYEALINSVGQVDTLSILVNKTYEE